MSLTLVISCEFCEFFKDSFLKEHLRTDEMKWKNEKEVIRFSNKPNFVEKNPSWGNWNTKRSFIIENKQPV